MPLDASFSLTGSGTLTKTLEESTPVDQVEIGSNNFPACGVDFDDGNAAGQAQAWWHDTRTVAAGVTDSIDLYGTAMQGPFGDNVQAVTVRAVIIAIQTPDGTKKLQVGPQAVANAAQLWFGGTGAQAYATLTNFLAQFESYAGWPITAGTADLLAVKNPTGVSVTYTIWVLFTNT
jgi:hypothetical protein